MYEGSPVAEGYCDNHSTPMVLSDLRPWLAKFYSLKVSAPSTHTPLLPVPQSPQGKEPYVVIKERETMINLVWSPRANFPVMTLGTVTVPKVPLLPSQPLAAA